MTATHHERTITIEQVRIRGGDLNELDRAVAAFIAIAEDGSHWHVEGDTVVLESPTGELLVGGSPWAAVQQESVEEAP